MKVKIANFINRIDLHKLKSLKKFFIKSFIVASIVLITMLFKKINLTQTNLLLKLVKNSIEYEFSLADDGQRVFGTMQRALEKSIETLNVYNPIKKEVFSLPIEGTLYRDYQKGANDGIDIRAMEGKEAISIVDGIINKVEQRDKTGYFITIQYENMEIVYGYFSQTDLAMGDKISMGDTIGTLGTNKDGYKYLRFEIWEDGSSVNPLNYINMK